MAFVDPIAQTETVFSVTDFVLFYGVTQTYRIQGQHEKPDKL